MTLSNLSDDVRQKFGIKDGIDGVVVADVASDSSAADKHIQAGDVIQKIDDAAVAKPDDVVAKINAARDAKKKSVLMLIANAQGDTRFVAISLSDK